MTGSDTRPPLEVVCAIVPMNERILVARRSKTMTHPGKWEFPGGKIERGETQEMAIVREIREELGASVRPVTLLTPSTHAYPHRTIRLIPVVCKHSSGEFHPHEHDLLAWASRDELSGFDWCDADLPIVAEVGLRWEEILKMTV